MTAISGLAVELYEAFRTYEMRVGVGPSSRELMQALGWTSRARFTKQMRALIDAGMIVEISASSSRSKGWRSRRLDRQMKAAGLIEVTP